MWKKFSSSNSSYILWPPDAAQKQKSTSLVYPTHVNSSGCFSENSIAPFPSFGAQGCCSFHLNSAFMQQLNLQALNPANETLGLEFTTKTKKFLIFDQSGDRTSLVANPNLPATIANYAYVPNAHDTEEMIEMHEDTEEIDALLYSDSEYSYDSEEASTGHSPLVLEEEEIASPSIPTKRRRLNLSELDASVMDAARVPSHHFITDDDNVAEVSYVEDNSGEEITSGKRKRSIQTTLNVLRRIIPGGKGKDAALVLDEAILYLKYLMLQAKALGVNTTTMYN